MSTRSIIVITGASKYHGGTIRLYKHSDGYPTGNLPIIKEALNKAIQQCSEYNKRYTGLSEYGPSVEQVTGLIIGESTSIHGMGACLEESFDQPFEPNHLGDQEDLEWIYLIDLNKQTVKIYGGGYTGKPPQSAYKKGTVNPESCCKRLKSEYQQAELEETRQLVKDIEALGFKVNPKRTTKSKSKGQLKVVS